MAARLMIKTFRLLLIVVAVLLGGSVPALAVTPTDIVIEDRAGVLDPGTLVPAIAGIEFHEPTKVAVYTYNGSAADNLNEEVLRFARSEHPDWISTDGQKWADGLFIFALDPVGRHVGTYMGEDRKVSLEQREDIQNAAKDLLRDAQWTEGTIAGVRRGAELINQPWYRSAAFMITAWVTGGVAVAGTGAWLIVRAVTRSAARKELERGDRSYASVSTDLDVTELNARTIPESSRYGSSVLEKHRNFLTRYNAASELSNRVHALTPKALSRGSNLQLVREYADKSAELDALDDVIADSNTLLNKFTAWPAAWDRQLAPFRSDLAGVEQLLSKRHGQSDSATAAALRSFRDESLRGIESWTAELADGTITPETALDRLRDARSHLSVLLKNHAETVIEGFAKTDREARLMRRELENAQEGTDRQHRRAYGSVNSARGGDGTTGYGSSGGSFSGSGSSSSF